MNFNIFVFASCSLDVENEFLMEMWVHFSKLRLKTH